MLGYTLKDVADFIGVSEATISRWESGEIGNMRRDRIAKLSKILEISPIDIIMTSDAREEFPVFSNKPIWQPTEQKKIYYKNKETEQLAQEAHDNPDLKILFDASRKLSPQDLKTVTALVKSLAGDKDE